MNSAELIKQLEAIIEAEKAKSTASAIEKDQKNTVPEQDIEGKKTNEKGSRFWHRILQIIISPFLFLAKYFKIEITEAIKHDIRRTMLVIILSVLLFMFLAVIWITVQCSIVALLIAQNFTLLNAIFISLGIQIICSSIFVLILYSKLKNMETLKLIRRLKKTNATGDN